MHRSVKTTARRGRHRLVATITLVACAALAAVASPAAASGADNGPPPGRGTKKRHADPTIGPLVAGTASYIDGTFVWTDYALDDRGPNTVETSVVGPRCTTPGGPDCSGGDAAYAPWAAPGNTADLIQLQIGADHRGVTIRAVLGSLVNPSLPVLGVAFDTDADTATGAATLPGGRWPAVDPLGVEKLVVASADGAQLWSHLTGSWQRVDLPPGLLRAHVDPERNTIDVRIHHSVLPATSGVWRAFGVLGVQNPDGGSWVDGSEEIMDLAFVGNEPFVRWQENRQADILAGTRATTHAGLSSAEAAAQLDWNKIWGRVTELTDATSPGFHTYLFRSKLDLPEGVTTPAPEVSLGQHEYLGPYQPYLVFIPESPPPGNPLTVDLHGANNNHLQSIFVVPNGDYVGTSRQGSEDFFLVTQFVPDVGVFPTLPETITIYPLGRGETLGYRGISEIDVLEATADAIERLDIDPNRVSLQGSSMGGIGAYRLGVLYPDRWSSIVPHLGSGDAVRHLFQNLRNVPVRQINGALDTNKLLGPASEADAVRLDELGYDHHYWLVLTRGHEGAPYFRCVNTHATLDHVRNPNPAEVVYTVDPALFEVNPARDVDLRYDSAYWVSGITVREPAPGTVAATSRALPHHRLEAVRTHEVRGNTVDGQDLCGPNPNFPPGWSPVHPDGETWRERSLRLVEQEPLPQSNQLEVSLTNVAAVVFDLDRAGLGGAPGTVLVDTDGPATLRFAGLARKAPVAVDGQVVTRADRHGGATVSVGSGQHTINVG